MDAAPAPRLLGIGVSGHGRYFHRLPFRNDPSGAWEAVARGLAAGDLAAGLCIGHLWWERRRARAAITEWMAGAEAAGEPRSVAFVCVSWGAVNGVALAEWFAATHGRPARLFVLIEGVGRWGWPCRRAGPAEIRRAYAVGSRHWPAGGTVPGADNHDLREHPRYRPAPGPWPLSWMRQHVAGEWAGCAAAVTDIQAAARGGSPP